MIDMWRVTVDQHANLNPNLAVFYVNALFFTLTYTQEDVVGLYRVCIPLKVLCSY